MLRYLCKRILLMVPTLLVMTVAVFFLMQAIPGDIIDVMQAEPGKEELDRAALEKELGLDAPLMVRYARWMGFAPDMQGAYSGILQGDLGTSWSKKVSVVSLVEKAGGVTLELSVIGFIVSLLISLPVGIDSALNKGKWSDILGRSFAILCISLPSFWLASMCIVYPSIWWNYAPPIRLVRFGKDMWKNLRMFILPGVLLGIQFSGMIMRITRTAMLDVLRQDYIRTAKAKGLKRRVILVRHAFKNALIPVITLIGQNIPFLIGGTVVIEEIFSLPGLGRLLIGAFKTRDNELTGGIILLMAVIVMVVNLLVDLSYGLINPKIRVGGK